MTSLVRSTFCLVAFLLGSGPALAQPLPEGHTGIAAQYSMDEGIEAEPEVVFTEDFEAITTAVLRPESSGWDAAWRALNIINEPENVYTGSQALEITHTNPGESIGAWRDFGTNGFDTLFVRYYMKYHPDFPGCWHTGMGFLAAAPGVDTGSSTGVRPNGSNHFTATLDNLAPFVEWSLEGNRPPGFTEIYCYHMDQSDNYGDIFFPSGFLYGGIPAGSKFDESFVPRPDIILDNGRWYAFELMLKANTIGERDGRIAFWVDGVLSGDFPGLLFRTTDELKVNTVFVSTYSEFSHDNKTLWYDDIVVATSYIGPMVGVGPRPDAGPHPDAGPRPDGGGSAAGADAGDSGCDCRLAGTPSTPKHTALIASLALLLIGSQRRRIESR